MQGLDPDYARSYMIKQTRFYKKIARSCKFLFEKHEKSSYKAMLKSWKNFIQTITEYVEMKLVSISKKNVILNFTFETSLI